MERQEFSQAAEVLIALRPKVEFLVPGTEEHEAALQEARRLIKEIKDDESLTIDARGRVLGRVARDAASEVVRDLAAGAHQLWQEAIGLADF